ncbi:MAG: arsenate reductase (glutaredoxin) [Flavobacteriaceae bacterium]|nr:arsenate reductase (glutaredoxin) [Flavobacteriaceae bacterium]
MTTIYHNPRCSKSRSCHNILADVGSDVQVINYMQTPFTEEKLKEILQLLKMNPIDLVRTNEAIWKTEFKDKKLTDKAIIKAMLSHPQLIERPIVVKGDVAIIARPLEKVLELLKR